MDTAHTAYLNVDVNATSGSLPGPCYSSDQPTDCRESAVEQLELELDREFISKLLDNSTTFYLQPRRALKITKLQLQFFLFPDGEVQ